jgi:hypothetical protein
VARAWIGSDAAVVRSWGRTSSCARACTGLWLLGALGAFIATAHSQDGGAQQSSALRERTAPRVLELRPLELPDHLLVTPEQLEIIVRIGVDGRGVIEEGKAEGDLRAQLEALIAAARFAPATIDGEAVTARVRLRLQVSAPEPVETPSAEASPSAPARPPAQLEELDRPTLGARAEVDAPRPTARKLELAEMRDVPGAFGDPFRVVETLPGVVPMFSGVPYVYVRGAPPAGTSYVYDGIAMPSLFHLALGPAVIHPTLIGDLDFYAAVPPARFGRRTGGVFSAEGRKPRRDGRVHGEAEVRLLDVSAMIDAPLGDHQLTVAGRYGYPGLLLKLFTDEVTLAYWDYQLRYRVPISNVDRVELTWFGAYDYVGDPRDPSDDSNFSLEFHRAEARIVRERPGLEIGVALQGGYEQSSLGEEVGVHAYRLGPRMWSAFTLSDSARLQVGADMLAAVGRIDRRDDDLEGDFSPPSAMPDPTGPAIDPGLPVDPMAPMAFEPQPFPEEPQTSPFDDPLYVAVAGRNIGGLYAELELDVTEQITVAPGLRVDVWLTGSRTQTALEPRLITSYRPIPWLELHAGAGLGHQVASLPIPLPGFNDVALEQGLQQSISTEAGVELTPFPTLRFDVELFYNHLTGLLLPDLFLDCVDGGISDADDCPNDGSLPRGDVDAYGIELFIKRDASHTLSGWLSYTLGWADGHSAYGGSFTPSFDVRHVGNLVLQWQLGAGFSLGGRLHYRSGKVVRDYEVDASFVRLRLIEERLPAFFRADAQLIYGWTTSWGRMRTSLEWMNVTLSEEAIGLTCEPTELGGRSCEVEYAPAIFFPSLGLRGEF